MAEQSLKDKTVKGTFWSAADAFLGQGVTFIVGLVLARLLTPEEYGLIGIITIFTTIMLGVIDCGFSNALIRRKEVTDKDYNTLFFFNLAVSILMYFLLYAAAPWIAHFFEKPQLVSLARVMGLLLVFQSLSIVQYTVLSRNIDFKIKTKANIISAIISGIVGITLALAGIGVWALVAQQLVRQLFYSIFLWAFNRWLPSFNFSKESLAYMWRFGWKLLVSGLLDRIWAQLYQIVVGKFYSPATLGQYSRSKEYASIFSSNLTNIVQRVSYPALSQIQDDQARIVAAYRRVIKMTMYVTAIFMITLGAISEPLIYCLIGSQWHQAATFLPFICISMSLYPLQAINLNMLQIQGRTDVFLYIEIIKKIIAVIPISLGIFVGIYWMLIGSIFTGITSFFLNSYYTGKHLGYSSWMQIKDIAPSYGVALVVALSVYFLKYLPVSYWIILPLQIVIGSMVLVAVCKVSKNQEYVDALELVRPVLASIKNRFKR